MGGWEKRNVCLRLYTAFESVKNVCDAEVYLPYIENSCCYIPQSSYARVKSQTGL